MNKLTLFLFLAFLSFWKVSVAQEIPYATGGNTYYSNSFDNGSLGSTFTYRDATLANQTIKVSNVSPIKGTQSLKSENRASSLTNAIVGQILPNNSTIPTGMEWSFLYKYTTTTNSTPTEIVDLPNVTAGKAGFRYWIACNNNKPSDDGGLGLYFTQIGNILYFKSKEGNTNIRDVYSYTLVPNTPYNIKLKKTVSGYTLFIDAYTVDKKDATTLIPFQNLGLLSTYNFTVLEVNEARTAASNYLQFDDLKLYTEKINLTNINSINALSSNPLSQGQKSAIIFGVKVNSRGVYNVYNTPKPNTATNGWLQFNIGEVGPLISSLKIYESTDAVFSVDNDPVLSSPLPFPAYPSQVTVPINYGSSESAGVDKYYFIVVDVLKNSNLGPALLKVSNFSIAYDNYNGALLNSSIITGMDYGIDASYIWTGAGASNTDWSKADNWTFNNSVPTSAPTPESYVLIPNTTNKPIANSSTNPVLNSLTIEDLATATFNSNLSISKSLNGAGIIQFRGSTDGTLTIGATAKASIPSLIIHKDAKAKTLTLPTTNGLLNITKNLTPTFGTLITNGRLVLKSSETSTAFVTAINTANASVQGEVTVERFIKGGSNARRGYRLMSSPVLQTANQYNVLNLMQNMYITGAGGSANGFEDLPNRGATVYKYKESNRGAPSQLDYTPISSPTELFDKGLGMYVFYRGMKNPTDANGTSRFSTLVVPENNVVSFKGSLIQGPVTVSLSYTATTPTANNADGFNLVGNPYASTIDLSPSTNIVYNELTDFIYVLNPSSKIFDVFNRTGTTAGTGSATRYIASGQGFFVKAKSNLNPSITFKEGAKKSNQLSTTLAPALLMGINENTVSEKPQYIRLAMVNEVDSNAKDDIVLAFNAGSDIKYNESEDAYDLGGNGTTFLSSLSSDKVMLAINSMPAITANTRIPIVANSTISGNFNFKAGNLNSMDSKWDIFLVDHYKADSVELNQTPKYGFTVDRTVPATYAASRFEISFREKQTLPTTLLNFNGKAGKQGAELSWESSAAANYNVVFTLQRSTDNVNFTDIYTVPSDQRAIYRYKDLKPGYGVFYYRLKQVDVLTSASVTKLIAVTIANALSAKENFIIYPNPVKDSYSIDLYTPNTTEVKVNIIDVYGKVVQRYVANTQSWSKDASQLGAGVYIVELIDNKTNNLIGRTKFSKF